MNAKQVLGLVGGLVFVAGLVVGFVPVSSDGVNCGSAFHESRDANVADLVTAMSGFGTGSASDSCDSLRSIMTVPALVLLVLGAVLGLVALVMSARSSATATPDARLGDSARD